MSSTLILTSVLAMTSITVPPTKTKKQEKQTVVLILLGPPGAGKGTQAGMLSSTLHLPHISTGDLLRNNIQDKTELGKIGRLYMDQGKLVPDCLILDMLYARINGEDCQRGYILDGFPRTLSQAQAYDKRLGRESQTIAINLSLNSHLIIERLSKRMTCKKCHIPYHLTFSPPKKEGVCDTCQGPLAQRNDDKESVIKKRLAIYEEETSPLIHYYSEKKNFKEFSCNQPANAVLDEILDYLCKTYYFPQKE